MARYRVSFFKDLLSSDGHTHKCTQQIIEIRSARTPDRAVEAAERRFERQRGIPSWQNHADYVEVEDAGRPREGSARPCPEGGPAKRGRVIH